MISTIPVAEDKTHILGYAQHRFWLLSELNPASPIYNIPMAVALSGSLDKALLQQSINLLVARHSILRTVFPVINTEPKQLVQAPAPVKLETIDLSQLKLNTSHEVIQDTLKEITRRPFQLTDHWPIRVALLILDKETHILLIVTHHIAIDGWSMLTLQRDLWALYKAGKENRSVALPDLNSTYQDFTAWQRDWLSADNLSTRLNFWEHNLLGANDVLPLPTDYNRPAQRSDRGAIVSAIMPKAIAGAVRALALKYQLTPFMVLISGFFLLLYRQAGQEDISIGIPVSNRSRLPRRWRKATHDMVGLFMNTVVMREKLKPDMSFSELLNNVRNHSIAALTHQDLPMEKLVEHLKPERSLARNPLFQVLFSVEEHPAAEPQLEQLKGKDLLVHSGTAKFDLTFTLIETPGQAQIVAEYSLDLFTRESVQRLMTHYQTILAEVTRKPESIISNVAFINTTERRQLLYEWNNTSLDYPENMCIEHMFELQVQKTPEAVALVCATQQFSYAEINQRAEQLANQLHQAGVTTGMLVAIYLPRQVELLIAILGILKAGGSWLPLDLSYPQQRLQYMLQDSAATLLITLSHLHQQLDVEPVHAIYMDIAPPQKTSTTKNLNHPSGSVTRLAYLMYTSGSTGKPKGVMVSHASVVALAHWTKSQYSSAELAAVLATTSISFDVAIFELLIPLLCGGSIVLIESILHLDQIPARQAVSLISSVPSAMQNLLQTHVLPESVLTINLAGEALSPELVNKLYQQTSVQKIYDLYGPTEATVYSTCGLRKPNEQAHIGRPILNTQVYILDAHLNPQPVGVAGELYIAGKGLALGYWKQPELTRQRFIDNPFNQQQNGKMYRSGDRARYMSNGNIEFLGRSDQQIKLRGFRIEPGEIEAVLRQHSAVIDAIVLLQENQHGDSQLWAYIKHETNQLPAVKNLRNYLKQYLPAYMLPAHFILLDQFPLNSNHKIDRNALKALESAETHAEHEYVVPQTRREKIMAEIWQDVLNVKRVGCNDNFFELGGHSLLTARLCTQIEARFAQSIPITWVFQYPTLKRLSQALEQKVSADTTIPGTIITSIRKTGKLAPLFWFGHSSVIPVITDQICDEQPLYLINHQALHGKKAQHLTVPAMAHYYLQAIQQIQAHGSYCLAGFSMAGVIMHETARMLSEQGQSIQLLFLLDPSDLSQSNTQTEPGHDFNPISQLYKLQQSGYVSYFKNKINVIKKIQRQCISKLRLKYQLMLIQIHFKFARPLPAKLHWVYLSRIYKQANQQHQPKTDIDKLEKVILVHSNTTHHQPWLEVLHNKLEILSIDSTHTQLMQKPYSLIWIKRLAQALQFTESKQVKNQ